jgi:membrane dipeptidase
MYRAPLFAGLTTFIAALAACTQPVDPAHEAKRIADTYIIVDTHIDVPYRLYRNPDDVSTSTDGGDFDHPRANAGGLDAPFMSIYVPAAVDEAGGDFDLANGLIDGMERLADEHPGKFARATCVADLAANFEAGRISLPLGLENGGPIDNDFNRLRHFYERGIRYVTLAHSKPNQISDSSYDENRTWQGLSPFGRDLIGEMNRLGVMVDVSHVSDDAFWQVIELSKVPVIASHSSLRHFTAGFERNMSDEMVAALAAAGGVVQINYGSNFISQETQDYGKARNAAVAEFATTNALEPNDPAIAEFMASYRDEHPYPYATLEQVLDHIDRTVEIGGIDAVGIGSDYDGVGDSLPEGLKDVASYPNLIAGLLERGYDEDDIAKILGGNLIRVWRAVEDFAANAGNPPLCAQS